MKVSIEMRERSISFCIVSIEFVAIGIVLGRGEFGSQRDSIFSVYFVIQDKKISLGCRNFSNSIFKSFMCLLYTQIYILYFY
jgi:hypothetical protein